ncbi:hypothetical protein [Pararhizobium sp.]|uniref:hypothetical protein n=1 Tax=Pararhizobium sp. TaxID=1977563 RepID=UPI00271A93D8|nr:hypothetical protein [Pararhizobium sp.]MDO9416206.1 hypothetical protein [Pararhizobium sp.]
MLSQTGEIHLVGERPFARLEIITGVITGVFREDQAGTFELVSCYIGRPKVFVELIDASGDRQILYEGIEMELAVGQAKIWGEMVGVPVYHMNVPGAH